MGVPTSGPSWRDRLYFIGWSACIYSLIPLARLVQESIDKSIGRIFFGYFVLAAACAGFLFAVKTARRLSGRLPLRQLLILSIIAVSYFLLTLNLWGNPEEAVHFVQYGVLGILALRLFSNEHYSARSALTASLMLCGIVGTVDEIIQWLVPGRYFDFRDIGINLTGSGLALAAVCWGVRPPRLVQAVGTSCGAAAACRFTAALVLLLAACFFNTPQRIERWAARFPVLSSFRSNPSVMNEFGFLHRVGDSISFKSRLTKNELTAQDRARAATLGPVLNAYWDRKSYGEYLENHTAARDPFAHEVRVHLYRRDRYIDALGDPGVKADPDRRGKACAVALSEHEILLRWFSQTYQAAGAYRLTGEQLAFLAQHADNKPYFSAVSNYLRTGLTEGQWAGSFLGLFILLTMYERKLARSCRNHGKAAQHPFE